MENRYIVTETQLNQLITCLQPMVSEMTGLARQTGMGALQAIRSNPLVLPAETPAVPPVSPTP